MKVALKDLLDVPVKDTIRFGIASGIIANHLEEKLRYATLVDSKAVINRNIEPWVSLFMYYRKWIESGCGDIALKCVYNPTKDKDFLVDILVSQFVVYCASVCNTTEIILDLCGDVQIDLLKHERSLIDYCLTGKDVVTALLCGELVKGENLLNDVKEKMFMCLVSQQVYALVMLPVNKFNEMAQNIKSKNKQLDKRDKQIKELQRSLEYAKSKPPVIQEVVVTDTEKEDALYAELQQAQQRLAVLEDKLAIYESCTTSEEFEVMEECFEEELDAVDLSQYKILIVGSYENKDAYPFPYVECKSDTAVLQKLRYVDYVLFDTRYNSHHTYFTAKNICKASGVKMFHINNRNKDVILKEAKRLIRACR